MTWLKSTSGLVESTVISSAAEYRCVCECVCVGGGGGGGEWEGVFRRRSRISIYSTTTTDNQQYRTLYNTLCTAHLRKMPRKLI